ncbi:unnamed protein product [Durusdinium trenchii]|uniref:CHASE domain-containing protein n=1 Tax=Durusdinium trenchii TaxID=1381693 RepID=A0ABP0LTY2_9DINO
MHVIRWDSSASSQKGVTTPVSAPPTPASPTLGSTQWPTFITASGVDDFNLVSLQSGISQKSAWSLHLNHEIALATAPDVAQKQRNFYTRRPVPLVMRWKRFWAVFALMCAGIGAGIYSISTQYFHALEELQGSARFAARLVTRDIVLKIRSSMPSLHVLEAAVTQGIDFAKNFEYIADSLRRKPNATGISAVALAPAGTISHVFPHSADLMGKPLLLHPDEAPDALQKAQKRRISVAAKCQAGDGTLVGYLPIRTSDADVFLPSEWFVHQGVNYSRDCSTAALREQHCRLPEEGGSPPPHRRRGRGRPPGPGGSSPGPGGSSSTLVGGFASDKPFWGFALVYSNFKDVFTDMNLERLQNATLASGSSGFAYQLMDRARPLTSEEAACWPSWHPDLLRDAVEVPMSVPELDLDWVLLLAPMNGWQVSFQEFWSHLLLDLCRALLSIFLCIHALAAFCKRAKEIEQLERYRQDSITKAIMASLDALSNFSFPLCLISIEDFKQFPRLMYYEELRDNGCHQCVDSVEDGMLKYKTEGVLLLSMDISNGDRHELHASALQAIDQLMARGTRCAWIWTAPCCIPQRNSMQRQSAINCMASFCTCFSTMLCLTQRTFVETFGGVTLKSEATVDSRCWTTLERLCFMSCQCLDVEHQVYVFKSSCRQLEQQSFDTGIAARSLELLQGSFSCCVACHPNGICEKQRVVGVILGLYWRFAAADRESPSEISREILRLWKEGEDRNFPAYFTLWSGNGPHLTELFGGYFPVLRQMFHIDSQLQPSQRLRVPMVTDKVRPDSRRSSGTGGSAGSVSFRRGGVAGLIGRSRSFSSF